MFENTRGVSSDRKCVAPLPGGKGSSFTSGWAGTAPAAGACESKPATDTVGWLDSVGGRSLTSPSVTGSEK